MQPSNSKPTAPYISVQDYLVSGETFRLVKNKTYGYLETTPQPEPNVLSSYYESEDYISHTDSNKGLLAFLYQKVKSYSLKKKLRLIKSLNNGKGSVLDIGAGTGTFLKVAEENGWVVRGVEVSEKAREFSLSKGIDLEATLRDVTGEQFDVVTLWHVLEHLPNIHNQIEQIEKLVRPGGSLVVAVPNFNSYDASYYKEFWAAYDVPRHLWHFSKESMRRIFSSEMNLVNIRPMIFDSFYVSLLSEKYKTGTSFSLRSFWIGFRSNWSALQTKEYSSLIYCFKKSN